MSRFQRPMTGGQLCLLCAIAVTVASQSRAQAPITISGVVTDAQGQAVEGATISVANTVLTSRTDERGQFRISGVSPGSTELRARRLGYAPTVRTAELKAGENHGRFDFALTELPIMLDRVVVQRAGMKYTGRLAGYYERLQRRSAGQFLTREDFDRNQSLSLSQLIARSPGVNSVRLRSGGGAVRMRGRSCRPLVWIDGVPMPAGEVDLDAFPVSSLHGAELYLGSTSSPMDFTAQQNRSSCGSILLWSRGRDTETNQRPRRSSVDLEELVASLSVYTPDQVDIRAELKSRDQLEAAYPPELFAMRASGTVVVEFVVDAGGKLERNTFAVVSSTHAVLSAAVARALAQSTFSPAMKDRNPVRQFVRQRFDFGPNGRSSGSAP